MARLYLLFALVDLVLVVVALIGCLSAEEDEIRALPKLLWVLLILLFSPVGPIAWFIAGRPRRAAATPPNRQPGSGYPERARPPRATAPDDDPEFLNGLADDRRTADDELMRRWEQDLRRREEELRRRRDPAGENDGS